MPFNIYDHYDHYDWKYVVGINSYQLWSKKQTIINLHNQTQKKMGVVKIHTSISQFLTHPNVQDVQLYMYVVH